MKDCSNPYYAPSQLSRENNLYGCSTLPKENFYYDPNKIDITPATKARRDGDDSYKDFAINYKEPIYEGIGSGDYDNLSFE